MSIKVNSAFAFDPKDYQEQFSDDGYVFIGNGVDHRFISMGQAQLESSLEDPSRSLSRWNIKSKKTQYLFNFPTNDVAKDIITCIAAVTSKPVELMMISERHLKVYSPDADPNPPAHKDRFESEFSVGVPLTVSEGSHVVLWPDESREINGYSSTAEWRDNLAEADLPENVLKGVEPLRVDVQVGDVIIFLGSSIFHERANGAGTVMAYFKLNSMRCDPLAEDPFAEEQRSVSSKLLEASSDAELMTMAVEVSPRLLKVEASERDQGDAEGYWARLADREDCQISQADLELLRDLDPRDSLCQLIKANHSPERSAGRILETIRKLGRLGVVDVLEAPLVIPAGFESAEAVWLAGTARRLGGAISSMQPSPQAEESALGTR